MRHSAYISVDAAMVQMELVSSESPSGSSIADSSDLASFSKDHSEDDSSLDSSALGQAATLCASIPENFAFTWKNQDNASKVELPHQK